MTVMSASPRHILVSVRTKLCKMDVMVGHAPDSGHGKPAIAEWWKGIATLLKSRKDPQVPVLALFDANARLGSITSKAVGDHMYAQQDFPGECMHDFLLDCKLAAPSTFAECSDGCSNISRRPTCFFEEVLSIGQTTTSVGTDHINQRFSNT